MFGESVNNFYKNCYFINLYKGIKMIRKSLKKNLLTTASVAALGAFASAGANAASLSTVLAGGTANAGYTLDSSDTVTGTVADAGTATNSVVQIKNATAYTLTVSATTGIISVTDDSGGADTNKNFSAIETEATPNASTAIVNNGTIRHLSPTGTAIDINHAIDSIVNTGTISALTTGSAIDVGASIAGTSGITNSGTIQSGAGGSGILTSAAVTLNITNSSAGVIKSTGNGNGIKVATGAMTGAITNAGTIQATGGIGINVDQAISGGIINTGTIADTTTGVGIDIAAAANTNITNSGASSVISTATGDAILVAAATVNITNGASGVTGSQIKATGDGSGIRTSGAVTGDITNWGTISSAGIVGNTGASIWLGGTLTGNIYNKSGATISNSAAGAAVYLAADVAGTSGIVNAGTITASAANAASIGVQVITADQTVGLTNTGTIQATAASGIGVQTAKNLAITNSGTISATTGSGINVSGTNSKTITNSSGGTIQSTAGTGITVAATLGKIDNTGTIKDTTTGTAININNSDITSGIVNNSGGVISSGTGIAIDVDTNGVGVLTNAGTITSGATGDIDTIDITGASAGFLITNTGTISQTGATAGADGSAISVGAAITGAGGILNSSGGTISITSANNTSAVITTGDVVLGVGITNNGTISHAGGATSTAIDLSANDSQATAIVNTGTITGQIKLGTANTYTHTSGTLTGAITGDGGAETVTMTAGTITGNISMGAGADVLTFNGGTISGNIDLGGNNNDTINFGDAAADEITFTGTLAYDDMVAKYGTTTLTGVFTGDAGSTITVNSGATLYVQSTSSNAAATTINGTLQIGAGKVLTSGTTVALNDTLTIDVTTAAAGTTTNGQLVSSGAVTYGAAGQIAVNYTGSGYQGAATITKAVDAGGARAGSYTASKTLTDNSYVLKFTQESNGTDDIDIGITREHTLQSSSTLGNQAGVGTALEAIGAAGDSGLDSIQGSLQALESASAIESALETLTPDVSGAIDQAADLANDAAIDSIEAHMDMARNDADGTGIATGSNGANSGIWAQGFGTASDQGDRDGVAGYQANTGGFALGADTLVTDQARVGISFAYANSSSESQNTEADIDSYQGSVYGSYDYGKWFSEGLAAFTYNKNSTDRTLFNGTIASADFDGQQYTAKVGGGYKIDVQGGLKVTPRASLKYTFVTTDSYSETGTAPHLNVDTADRNILKSSIGVDLAYPIVDGGITYVPKINAAWMYDFIGDEQETTSEFASAAGTYFTTTGADVAQSSFRLGAGLDVMAQDNVTVSVDYNWDSKEDYNSHTGSLKARFAF